MKKLILSSVFAGLMLTTGADASTATPEKGNYGKISIKADFAGGYYANVYHKPSDAEGSSIDSNNYLNRHIIALTDSKISLSAEGGCSTVAFGALVKLDANPAALKGEVKDGKFDASGIFRDVYMFGRFGNVVEVRVGSQRDAISAMVDADSIMGGTGGYNGYFGAMVKNTKIKGSPRKDRFMLDLDHANNTGYTNAFEVRTMRLAGFQVVGNFKPSDAYNGRIGTFGNGEKTIGANNNIFSAALNYDNKFGDFRLRLSTGAVWVASDKLDASGKAIADQALNLAYRLGGIVSWNSFDIGLGWLDSQNAGKSGNDKEIVAGRAIHAALGYQFESVMWKPRISVGGYYGWKNGKNGADFKDQDATLDICGAIDLNIRDGFRWYVEGGYIGLDERNDKAAPDAKDGQSEKNFIIGTGLAVSQ